MKVSTVTKDPAGIGKRIRNHLYIPALAVLFAVLISASLPEGAVFGSHTDWLSQHVTLAETIRNACLEQHTLLPSWIDLGGGSNGYMFSYYGFLRPDILIGCLLPDVPMLCILTGYMLAIYLISVLLCFVWLRSEQIRPLYAFTGSVLFMTAGCLFHMHRQIMFVNYLPFLLAALLCIRRKCIKLLPLFLCLICLSSFYFSIASFAAVGWYWYQREHQKRDFLLRYLRSVLFAVGMSAALLLPTAFVLLEHRRSGQSATLLSVLELFGPNPAMNNLLFNEYGMGLSFVCFYTILAGLTRKAFRKDSLLFLLFGLFGIFSWILNGTLYARPKILIPFMPLVILHCVRYWQEMLCNQTEERLPLRPFAVILPVGLLWFLQPQFPWIITEIILLLAFCLLHNRRFPHFHCTMAAQARRRLRLLPLLLLVAPIGLYLTTASTEDWVYSDETDAGFTPEELAQIDMDPLYHFDSMAEPLISGNELPKAGMSRSTMYSSITNQTYSDLYYDILQTPIRINNRVALLTSDNPFMLHLLGVRYLETTADHIPAGYKVIAKSGDNVIAENENVLPRAYFTKDISKETAPEPENLRDYTPDITAKDLPGGLTIQKSGDGYEITAEKNCVLEMTIGNPSPGDIVLLSFRVENLTHNAVVIDINGIRNKLSGTFAPYPNGNDCFHYQLSTDSEDGVAQLSVTFSKGHYILHGLQCQLYDQELLTVQKYTQGNTQEYTPVASEEITADGSYQVLSGSVAADSSGYLVTSIPLQKGLKIFVDGKPAELITVNEAFAGVSLSEGKHHIDIRFSPPGKTAGCIVSLLSLAGYAAYLTLSIWKKRF